MPQDNAAAWLRYLRHTAPAVPFRCSTQQQSKNLTSRSSPDLLRLIKSYKSGPGSKITVGVVGYPNVGKSSLINSLKRSKVHFSIRDLGPKFDPVLIRFVLSLQKRGVPVIFRVFKLIAASVSSTLLVLFLMMMTHQSRKLVPECC